MFNKVTRGVMFNKVEAEGKRLKNPFDTITEGVGINRLTANFALAIGCDETGRSQAGGLLRTGTRRTLNLLRLLLLFLLLLLLLLLLLFLRASV
jgi:cysteine synthase A